MSGKGFLGRSLRLLVVVILVMGVIAVAAPAAATTVTVNTEAEYRQALTDLSADNSGPHTIKLGANIILAGSADPTYSGTQPLTIEGYGYTLDGDNNSRVLKALAGSGDVTFVDTTITRGRFLSGGGAGGGVWLVDANLRLVRSVVTGNTSPGNDGGGVASANLVAIDSVISNNVAGDDAGGITANRVMLIRSTVSNNTASGFRGEGGGVHGETVIAIESTISGNTLTSGGGGKGGGGIMSRGPLTLIKTEVTGNTGPKASNVRVWDIGNGSGLKAVWATVTSGSGGPNCLIDGATKAVNSTDDDGSCGF